MSRKALENLRRDWPKRHALNPEEVAVVLGRNSNSRGVLQKIREGMKSGRYPGARKIDGHWQLPLEDLAEILDQHPKRCWCRLSPNLVAAAPRLAHEFAL